MSTSALAALVAFHAPRPVLARLLRRRAQARFDASVAWRRGL